MKQGSSALVYLNGDHLSSTALATTSTGAFLERQGYYGYGKYRSGGVLPTDNRYTGQKLDAATGLYYYGARYYDRMVGMFVSPDTLVPDPTNVWDWNRYAYGRLNPLRYSDPSGHNPWDTIQDALGAAADFAQGVGAQVGYNNTSMAVPSAVNVYTPQDGESTAMTVGRHVGNLVSGVQGVVEMTGGAGAMSGGVAACSTGAGCLAGAPAVAVGATLAAHGATVGINAALQEGQMLANLMMAVAGSGDASREIRSFERSIKSFEKNIAEHETKLEDYIRDPYAPHNDNQGLLKNAPSDEVRQRIIQARIRGLEQEIQNYRNQLEQARQRLAELTGE